MTSLHASPRSAPLGLVVLLAASLTLTTPLPAAVPLVDNVELQPLKAQVQRVVDALGFLGEPFSNRERRALQRAYQWAYQCAIVAK